MNEMYKLTPEFILQLALIDNDVADVPWDFDKFHALLEDLNDRFERSGYLMKEDDTPKQSRLMMYKSYKKDKDGNSVVGGYAFGPDWVGSALAMDDIRFDTEAEAVLHWYYHIFKKGHTDECDKSSD